MRSPRFLLKKCIGRWLVRAYVSKKAVVHDDGIAIYYDDAAFAELCKASLQLLREHDMLHYMSVRQRVRSIIELGEKSSYIGYVCGAYIDYHSRSQRVAIGARRYAGYLVRFATYMRLIEWGFEDVINFRAVANRRIAKVAARRELKCCLELGCEMTDIYHIQRWLRNQPEGAKRKTSGLGL